MKKLRFTSQVLLSMAICLGALGVDSTYACWNAYDDSCADRTPDPTTGLGCGGGTCFGSYTGAVCACDANGAWTECKCY